MSQEPAYSPEATQATAAKDTWGLVLVALLFLWVVGLSAIIYPLSWLINEVARLSSSEGVVWLWPASAALHAVLLALPLSPLALRWRGPRYRAVFQTWALGALFALMMLPLRLLPVTSNQSVPLAQTVLTLLFSLVLLVILRRKQRRLVRGGRAGLAAVALAPLVVYPWLASGALGSPLDFLLNALAGLAFGIAVGLVVGGVLLPALHATSTGPGWDITLGGFVAGALLLVMGMAFSFEGMTFLLPFALPASGWVVVALGYKRAERRESGWLPVALFTGLAMAAPLALVDPEELVLVLNLGGREILFWVLLAALATMIVGWALGILSFLFRIRPLSARLSSLLPGLITTTWLLGGAIYLGVGQPGFHGDRLFVILREQADLSEATTLQDQSERAQFVFETLTTHATGTQADLRAALDRARVPYTPYYLVNALEIEGGPLHRRWLLSRPEVDRVLDSPILRPLPDEPSRAMGTEAAPNRPGWNLTLIGAERVWNELGVTGEGIAVGQSDSGVQGDHPELLDSYRGNGGSHDYNWFDPWFHTTEPVDIGGHGTHTLGSVLGNSTGVAPDAEWFGCVNLARNLANPALYLDCMQFMLAPFPLDGDPFTDGDPARGAHVINNSWGCPELEGCDALALRPAVHALRAAGIFVVASAGNDGPACSTVQDPIALYDEAFSVGAVDRFGQVAGFSSRGPVAEDGSGRVKPDIAAPGVEVLSAYPGSTYAYADGTSMAGPHIAGVVALIWSANPALIGDIEGTEQILIETAQPYTGITEEAACGDPSARPNNLVGYGIVDAYGAVQRALEVGQ